ncbi:MAG: hypothetical protein IPH45_16950, partial [Bacteroidales bacterium]|nr:hypothetical protein [Bacteroidales bacterium]
MKLIFFLKNIGLLKNGKRFNCGRFNERCPNSSYNKLEKRVDTNVSRQLDSKVRFENLATIKIWADGDDIPGSLALCLADFLMLGAEIRQNSYNRTSVFNVIYEYCSLCSLD